jgi:hypothetical protein
MPSISTRIIALAAQDVPWIPVNPTITFAATTVTIGGPVTMTWAVPAPSITQPLATTVSILAPVSMTWAVLQPTVYGLQYVPPFVGEIRESGVEIGEIQEAPGP